MRILTGITFVIGLIGIAALTAKPNLLQNDRAGVADRAWARVGLHEILERTENGETVSYVDARELDELSEEHLPRALHLPLRAISSRARSILGKRNSLIIAYCIKDFRGYEVARALQRQGYTNVRVMVDPGLKGWKAAKLPTAGTLPGRTDEQAMAELKQRAAAYVAAHPTTAQPATARPSPP